LQILFAETDFEWETIMISSCTDVLIQFKARVKGAILFLFDKEEILW